MPRGDGTGPAGMGPMTGRAAGLCAGNSVPGYANAVGGRRFWAQGRGGGRGWRNWFGLARPRAGYGWPGYDAAPLTINQELKGLKGQAEYLENALGDIKKRIEELESQKSNKE